MKKSLVHILIAGIGLFLFPAVGKSQLFNATSYTGSTSTSLVISIKPDFSFNDKLNEVGFVIQVPKVVGGNPIPLPTISVLNNFLSTTFADWNQVSESASNPDFYNFKFGATGFASAPLLPTAAGAEIQVVELQFSSPAAVLPLVRLAHLPSGGPGSIYGAAIIDGSLVDRTDYVQMFYGNGLVPSVPASNPTIGYDTYQYVLRTDLVPVQFLGFNAIKKENDAILTWNVENESAITDRYEIERSFNGSDFVKFNTLSSKNNGLSRNGYSTTDYNLTSLRSSGVIYYRVKQVDKDGRSVYTAIKSVRTDGKTFDASVYPNPVVNIGKINIDLSENIKINIILTDASGKEIQTESMDGVKGLNKYELNMSKLAAGTYFIKINAGNNWKTLSLVKKI